MSPAMNALEQGERGKVDLFYNDMWGLKCTLETIDGSAFGKDQKK